ncbi:MAG TPA: 2OG-Fe(II) oxygenase [Acidimicrobiales bacterium]|nr:2OG-Fe(II) oxygenase [Acidimicrobiales bacterium]
MTQPLVRPSVAYFRAAGFFVVDDFLSPAECTAMTVEMAATEIDDAPVVDRRTGAAVVRPSSRRTRRSRISAETKQHVKARLDAMMPMVSAHFAVGLSGVQSVDFLTYRRGDHFRRHLDVPPESTLQEAMRKVSGLVFLNSGYTGGGLQFYGLLPPGFEDLGVAYPAATGSLLCFRSDIEHQVLPVAGGIRYSIAAWYE